MTFPSLNILALVACSTISLTAQGHVPALDPPGLSQILTSRKWTVIEFGGAYSKRKLAEFHRHCATRGLPYEIW